MVYYEKESLEPSWDLYQHSDPMVSSPDSRGLYLGLDDADDALELDSYLNLPPSSQPASQPNDLAGVSIVSHSIVTPTPGPATFVDGDPVQGS